MLSIYPHGLDINDSDVNKVADYLLPFSTGFEIECFYGKKYNVDNFTAIENIMEVRNDKGEQRYRIPSGLMGLRCLYDISYQLKFNCERSDSGIHYQVDCTEWWDKLYNAKDYHYNKILEPYKENILLELDTWQYQGSYNKRDSNWYRLNSDFKTIEFRIGEMTFDYPVLFNRIIHCNAIVDYLKNQIIGNYLKLNSPILMYGKKKEIKNVLKNRIEKI